MAMSKSKVAKRLESLESRVDIVENDLFYQKRFNLRVDHRVFEEQHQIRHMIAELKYTEILTAIANQITDFYESLEGSPLRAKYTNVLLHLDKAIEECKVIETLKKEIADD